MNRPDHQRFASTEIHGRPRAASRMDERRTDSRPAASALARLRPVGRATELLAHGAILFSCAEHLEEFISLHRARRTVVLAASMELRLATVQAAAMAPGSDDAVGLARDLWSEQLARLAAVAGLATEEAQLLANLRTAATGAEAEDPYTVLFKRVAGRARALYDIDWPPLEFIVRTFSDSRHDRYPIQAETVPASGRSPIAVVLKLDPVELIPDAFAAIPGLLIHECVCHVASRTAGDVDNRSAFAEGVMDYAARYFRALWLRDFGPLRRPAEEHAQGVFDAIAQRDPTADRARRFGERVADKLAKRLELRMSPGEAAAATAILAVRLNVADAPLVHKDVWVALLDEEGSVPVAPEVLEVIRGTRDPLDLL